LSLGQQGHAVSPRAYDYFELSVINACSFVLVLLGALESSQGPAANPNETPINSPQSTVSPGTSTITRAPQVVLPSRVATVVVRDNEKTKPGTVKGIAGISPGDLLTDEKLSDARRRLHASGLFQVVEITPRALPNGETEVEILVKDKISWVIAPMFSFSSSNVGGGILYAENNLFGENKKFIASGQYTSAESGVYLGFLNSNIFNWYPLSMTLETLYKLDRIDEDQPLASAKNPFLERRTKVQSFGGGIGFIVNWFDVIKTAARYRYLRVSEVSSESPLGFEPAFDGPQRADANLRLSISYDTLREIGPIQDGTVVELGYESSSSLWGSSYRYREIGATFRYGWRLFENQNLRFRASSHFGFDYPFHAELVAGGNNLRGYLYREFRGDTRFAGSAEYHFPIFKVEPVAIRGVAFYDAAMIYFRDIPANLTRVDYTGRVIRRYLPDEVAGPSLKNFGNGAGVGLRFYLSNIVLPLLGIDYGVGINSGAGRVYLVIGVGT
jgi:outer membrane protein assembly factor BamA